MRTEVKWTNTEGVHSLGEFDMETSLKLVKLLSTTRDFLSAEIIAIRNSYSYEQDIELNGFAEKWKKG